MSESGDPAKKHWILILVIIPIILALIAIVPQFLGPGSGPPPASGTQTNVSGNNNQVQIGDGNTQNSGN
jgi:hypothetical protein